MRDKKRLPLARNNRRNESRTVKLPSNRNKSYFLRFLPEYHDSCPRKERLNLRSQVKAIFSSFRLEWKNMNLSGDFYLFRKLSYHFFTSTEISVLRKASSISTRKTIGYTYWSLLEKWVRALLKGSFMFSPTSSETAGCNMMAHSSATLPAKFKTSSEMGQI